MFAPDEATRQQKLQEAFFSIDIFKRVYDHYGSAKLPEREFLSNVLQGEFGLSSEFHDEFAEIFRANCEFWALRVECRSASATPVEQRSSFR